MKDEDMKLENLRHVDVEIYEVLMTRIHQVMKDWGFTFNEAINLFLDWGSIQSRVCQNKCVKDESRLHR